MKKLIMMAMIATSVVVMGDEVKEIKVEEPVKTVVTMPIEGIEGFSQEEMNIILERDQERAKWLAERVKAAQEKEEAKKVEEKALEVEPEVKRVVEDKHPIVSQVITVNEMFNHRTVECFVDDWVVVRLNAQDGNRWELGEDKNGVVDLLMTYHNAEGKKPRVVNLDWDFDEDEGELVTIQPNAPRRTANLRSSIFPSQAPRPGARPAPSMNVRPNNNEVYVFEFQAMKEGVEKITLNHIDTHMYIQMIGAPRPPQIPPFEITVKVLPDEKTNVTDTVRVKGKDSNNFETVNIENKTVQVKVGDTIEVMLQNKLSSGFDWDNNDNINAGVITRTDYQYRMGYFVNTYKVEKAGTCAIYLIYMRPHEPNNFDLNKFYTLRVEAKE